jgi:hypothetical protein
MACPGWTVTALINYQVTIALHDTTDLFRKYWRTKKSEKGSRLCYCTRPSSYQVACGGSKSVGALQELILIQVNILW